MAVTINGSSGVTYPAGGTDNVAGAGVGTTDTQTLTNKTLTSPIITGGTVPATSGPDSTQLAGNRNKIINGAMMIDQRNAGASVTPTSGIYTLDRWITYVSANSKLSIQQSTTAPAGFSNSALITSLSAYSVGASETFLFGQKVEGFNSSDLSWGTASAKTVTLSFWVRSSLTGTFGGSFGNASDNRWYPFSYTINSANTWEQKTITIVGDTSGTWGTGNGIGINVYFSLGTGSTLSGASGSWSSSTYYSATGATSIVGTNGATFYITGVQLEKGATATPFENRLYGTELALCQRYYLTGRGYSGLTSGEISGSAYFPVKMRTTPTVTTTYVGGLAGGLTGSDIADSDFQWWKSNSSSNYYRFSFTSSAEL